MCQAAADAPGSAEVIKILSDLNMPSRAYSDLTGVKNQSQIRIHNLTSAGTALRCATLRSLTRGPSAPRVSHCQSILCIQSLLVVSKYSAFRLAILRLSCFEFLETADVSIVISVIVHR
jgi:hypothetical protein